jgi:hypothetical protein
MKRKTRRMNVYLILPTSHMDELQLLKTKKALKDHTTQPVIQTGLEFWIEEPNDLPRAPLQELRFLQLVKMM